MVCLLCLPVLGGAFEYDNLYNTGAEFPQVLHFRSDTFAAGLKEDELDEYVDRFDGYMPKLAAEERSNMPIEQLRAVYHRMQQDHPEKLYMVHYNGEAVAVHNFKQGNEAYFAENLAGYFPGHWCFGVGTLLEKDIDPSDQTLAVADNSGFKVRDYVYHNARDRDGDVSFPTDIVVVPLDEQGRRLWDQSEYVALESKADGKIEVKRGRYGSVPRSFSAKRTLVLPIIGGSWASNAMWFFNFSTDCPRDAEGNQAADVYVRKLVEMVKGTDACRFVEGVGFDVLYFSARAETDTNNDNVADGGYVDGVNRFRQGSIQMLQRLRDELGPDAILSADSHHATNQRAVGILSGMESEGLVSHNDGYRGISTTINVHTYWQRFGCEPRFSYIVDKLRNEQDQEQKAHLEKLAHGMASVLGVGIGLGDVKGFFNGDRYSYLNGPKDSGPGWLGAPVSGALVIGASETFSKASRLINSADVVNGRIRSAGIDEWLIEGDDQGVVNELSSYEEAQTESVSKGIPLENIQLVLKDLDLRRGLTVKLDLKSEKVLPGLDHESRIPRFVLAELSEDVQYSKNRRINEQYTSVQGVMGASGWHPNLFYFRANPAKDAELKLSFEGLGDFRIRNVEIMEGPLMLARQFEHGAVIINLSEENAAMPIRSRVVDAETGESVRGMVKLEPLEARLFINR